MGNLYKTLFVMIGKSSNIGLLFTAVFTDLDVVCNRVLTYCANVAFNSRIKFRLKSNFETLAHNYLIKKMKVSIQL